MDLKSTDPHTPPGAPTPRETRTSTDACAMAQVGASTEETPGLVPVAGDAVIADPTVQGMFNELRRHSLENLSPNAPVISTLPPKDRREPSGFRRTVSKHLGPLRTSTSLSGFKRVGERGGESKRRRGKRGDSRILGHPVGPRLSGHSVRTRLTGSTASLPPARGTSISDSSRDSPVFSSSFAPLQVPMAARLESNISCK
mmetsp:Transcript_51055/g.136158  ORF Transcript_51055/g.136158 Transcript_51055/m.136158 type:complete len:200 (-) Transcript_51055:886-1485(-)